MNEKQKSLLFSFLQKKNLKYRFLLVDVSIFRNLVTHNSRNSLSVRDFG